MLSLFSPDVPEGLTGKFPEAGINSSRLRTRGDGALDARSLSICVWYCRGMGAREEFRDAQLIDGAVPAIRVCVSLDEDYREGNQHARRPVQIACGRSCLCTELGVV